MTQAKTLLVTGGAGFIGSNFVLRAIAAGNKVITLDALTYAGNRANLAEIEAETRHIFVRGDIADRNLVDVLLDEHKPNAIVHFAAESHVDRSILAPAGFIETNVIGTFQLLEASLSYWKSLGGDSDFRFLHVSTDEVYGSLDMNDAAFTESTAYQPNSPYSASKASSDHLVRAYHHTYGLPTLTTNCSNNYGPFQFPEKLIPLVIHNARTRKPIPVYGDGANVRDWLFVHDHCDAISRVLDAGKVGETYNIGGRSEKKNLDVVKTICSLLDKLSPQERPHAELITFVKDRPGHDRRYAVNCDKIERELGWSPSVSFEQGMRQTIEWYLANDSWTDQVVSGAYRNWIDSNYSQREVGTGAKA